jgi:hypothetical protein
MANNNKPMIDLPFFELCNQAPVASSAVTCMTTVEDGSDRYIYYMVSAAFYRYDTVADTWQLLATPPFTPAATVSMRYTTFRGFHGRVLGATGTTVTIPGLRGPTLNGKTIKILQGTGIGQERVLTYTGETIHAAGVITATLTNYLQDNTKKWEINQWSGYMVGITFGTDATQYKKCIYNDTNTLYFYDINLQPHDPWNNQPFAATAPYAVPVITAGAQAHYLVMSSSFTVPTWTVTPDSSSYFTTTTGGIYMVCSYTAAPWYLMYYYDVIADSWSTRTVLQGLKVAAFGTDMSLERTAKLGGPYVSKLGTTSATIRTLSDSGLALTPMRYNNYRVVITGGTGVGQNRRIVNHTATTFTIPKNWDVTPDATSTYEVWPDFDRLYLGGDGGAAMYAYSPEGDFWMQGQSFDDGMTVNAAATMNGWNPVGIATGVRIAAGVTAVNPVPTAGGANYAIGDFLTCSVIGTGAQVVVTSISAGGVVTGVRLAHSGTVTGFTTGVGKATTGGVGTGCTIEITAVGATALITTSSVHWFEYGDTITFSGLVEAAWNAAYTIIGVNSLTSFSVAAPTTIGSMTATSIQSITVIVDSTKNWINNEHVGRLVHLSVAGQIPTSQVRWIQSNTQTTLTVATIVAGVTGTSKYCIYDSKVFGIDDQRKETGMSGYGMASSGSTTTLADSSKGWIPNQWVGYLFKIEAGTGYGSGRIAITANSTNTLTFATQTFTPDTTTKYEIADAWGIASSGALSTINEITYKNWVVNQWAGKRVKIIAGTLQGTEAVISSNTATALTAVVGTPDATSVYAIYSIPGRGQNTQLMWMWGASDAAKKGRFMFSVRGGSSNSADIYDITTGRWTFGYFFSPQAELFVTGSSYAYDGADTIYMSRSLLNAPIRIFKYNINTNKLDGAGTTTILNNTVTIGNMMEIVDSSDSLCSYLYVMQNTGTILCRALLF